MLSVLSKGLTVLAKQSGKKSGQVVMTGASLDELYGFCAGEGGLLQYARRQPQPTARVMSLATTDDNWIHFFWRLACLSPQEVPIPRRAQAAFCRCASRTVHESAGRPDRVALSQVDKDPEAHIVRWSDGAVDQVGRHRPQRDGPDWLTRLLTQLVLVDAAEQQSAHDAPQLTGKHHLYSMEELLDAHIEGLMDSYLALAGLREDDALATAFDDFVTELREGITCAPDANDVFCGCSLRTRPSSCGCVRQSWPA